MATRHPGTSWRVAAWLPLGSLGLVLLGYGVGLSVALHGWAESRASVSAMDRASHLSNGVAEALNCSALFSLPALVPCLLSTLTFGIGSLLRAKNSPSPS